MDGHRKADIALDKLLVNPENYRFDPVADQQEAMITMLQRQKDKILNLARDIAQRGLNPMERLIVKEVDGGMYVVLEGNRRITALKLMTNPDELPGNYPYKGVFEGLHDQYKNILPTAVECVIYRADQQDSADRWIELKHTGENQGVGTVSWKTEQKQRFASRHMGQEPKTLQILEFLKENGIDISDLDVTSLERLLGTRGVPQMLGIDFPRKKKFILVEPQETVLQKLRKVVERMSADDFAVGQIYNAPQRVQWIQDVLGLQPAPATPPAGPAVLPAAASIGNAATSTNQATSSPAPTVNVTPPLPAASQSTAASAGTNTLAPSPTPPPPATSAPNTYSTLVDPMKPLPATILPKIVKIYKELQTVYISGQRAAPHAVGALLRILVEITAQEYLEQKHGFREDSGGHFRSTRDPNRTCDELRDKLNYIANNCGLPRNLAQVLRTLVGKQLMTAELNQVMHNTIFTADAAAIKGIWQNFENVFDYLIGEMK